MSDIEVTQEQMSYFQSYIQAFNNQSIYGSYLLSPQLLNDTLKSVNMNTSKLSPEQVEKMVLAPHNFEQELRKLSLHYYNSIGLYVGEKVELEDGSSDYINVRLFSYLNIDNKSVKIKTASQYVYRILSLV